MSVESLNCEFTYILNLTSSASILTYFSMCGSGSLFGIRIRIQEAPEDESNTDPDPQHWPKPCESKLLSDYICTDPGNLIRGEVLSAKTIGTLSVMYSIFPKQIQYNKTWSNFYLHIFSGIISTIIFFLVGKFRPLLKKHLKKMH